MSMFPSWEHIHSNQNNTSCCIEWASFMCVCSWWLNTCWMCCDTFCTRRYKSMESFPQDSSTLYHTQFGELTNTLAHTTAALKLPHNVIVNQVFNLVLSVFDKRYLCCLDIRLLSVKDCTSGALHTCFLCTTATNPPVWEPGEALLLEVEGIQSFGQFSGYWGWCTFCQHSGGGGNVSGSFLHGHPMKKCGQLTAQLITRVLPHYLQQDIC